MYPKNVEVRGCCMGIPFGCGSLLLLGTGAVLLYAPHSGQFLLTALVAAICFLFISLSALIGFEWLQETRSVHS